MIGAKEDRYVRKWITSGEPKFRLLSAMLDRGPSCRKALSWWRWKVWEDVQSGLLGDFLVVEGQLQRRTAVRLVHSWKGRSLPNASEIRFSRSRSWAQTFLKVICQEGSLEGLEGMEAGKGEEAKQVWPGWAQQLIPRDRLWSRNGLTAGGLGFRSYCTTSAIQLVLLCRSRVWAALMPLAEARSAKYAELGNGPQCW